MPLAYAGPSSASQLACPPASTTSPWFWTYDDEAAPSRVVLCESAFQASRTTRPGTFRTEYGCATR